MKTETVFDTLCQNVYKTIGLEYKPEACDEEDIEEVDCEIRKFTKKTKSYNINKDKLCTHYASKKLSKFIEESERKRRDAEGKGGLTHDADQLHKKEQVLDFINQLTAKAKVEKVHRDSVVGIKAGGAMVEALQELTHVTGVMKADKLSYEEQQRRVDELQSRNAQSKAVHLINQLGPVHHQLSDAFSRGNGDSKAALEHVRSDDNMSDHSAGSYDIPQKKSIELNCQMKGIISKVKYNPSENPADMIMPTDILHGVGHIGRTTKKNDKQFAENIHHVRKNSEAKYTMQNELLYKAQKSSVENTQKVDERGLGHERKMTLVLDSLVHKASGKEVQKQIAEAGREEALQQARRSTLDNIKDFGRRLSVAQDAKDTSYTKIKHDATSEKVHAAIVSNLGKNDSKEELKLTKSTNPGIKKVSAVRRSSIQASLNKEDFKVHVPKN